MLIIALGMPGSGKTLLIVMLSYISNEPIISNIKSLDIPNREIEEININKFIKAEYSNCIIILDEIYTYIESRISSSERNRTFSYILFQARKKGVTIIGSAQLLSTIDKRFRELADIFIECERINLDFHYRFFRQNKHYDVLLKYQNAEFFFNFYDTNEIILLESENSNKVAFQTSNSNEKESELERYAIDIIEYYSEKHITKITQNLVEYYCSMKSIAPFLKKSIYTQIKLIQHAEKESEKE